MNPENPLELFHDWMRQAESSEPNDPNAVALATASAEGEPSVRMVLMKRADDRGFCFFTNEESEKGVQLHQNPRAAMCFHWKSLRRQVRVRGPVVPMETKDVDEYFHSRSRNSQIGAAVSEQSHRLESREVLEAKVKKFAEEHPGEIPRPPYWKGYCLQPKQIEFWMDGAFRLHDRFLYTREGNGWKQMRLYP